MSVQSVPGTFFESETEVRLASCTHKVYLVRFIVVPGTLFERRMRVQSYWTLTLVVWVINSVQRAYWLKFVKINANTAM